MILSSLVAWGGKCCQIAAPVQRIFAGRMLNMRITYRIVHGAGKLRSLSSGRLVCDQGRISSVLCCNLQRVRAESVQFALFCLDKRPINRGLGYNSGFVLHDCLHLPGLPDCLPDCLAVLYSCLSDQTDLISIEDSYHVAFHHRPA